MNQQTPVTEEYINELKEDLQLLGYIASHDFKNPLREIQDSCQQLKDQLNASSHNSDSLGHVNHALEHATQLETLIDAMLEYSRISTGSKHFKEVDCNKALEEAIAKLKGLIDEKNAQVTFDQLPMIQGKRTQIIRLFYYLIHNALIYNQSDQVEIHIGCTQTDNNEWVFSISDNGIGIAPEYHEIIFILFQRLETPINYPGIGSGLALSKKIVQFHGGKIWVESNPPLGTTMNFSIQP